MSAYAIVRQRAFDRRYEERPPEYVMLVERETDASLMGSILGPEGEVRDWIIAFDTAPSYSVRGFGSECKRERIKPGRVRKERVLTRHASLEEANEALGAARKAWHAADDREREREASQRWAAADAALTAEKARLEAEMRKCLADLQKARDEAMRHLNETRSDIYAHQTKAAVDAASALPCHAGEVGR